MLDHAMDILSEDMVKHFHALLKANTSDSRLEWFNVGEYKQRPNMVGESKTTPPKQVKKEMEKLEKNLGGIKEMNPLVLRI